MVKAKEFWEHLCEGLEYRFFAGVACKGLNPLYKKMNPDVMHYIPASNERIALGLVSGAYIGGFKGGLLMDMLFKNDLTTFLNFNLNYKIPFIIIAYSSNEEEKLIYDLPITYVLDGDYKDDINRVTSESESNCVPGVIVIEEDVLS